MKKVIRLTEADLVKLVKRVINEQTPPTLPEDVKTKIMRCGIQNGVGLILKYPICTSVAIDIAMGKIDVFSIPGKISQCLSELRKINSSDIENVSKILYCLSSSSMF
jgi:hypothetical protein